MNYLDLSLTKGGDYTMNLLIPIRFPRLRDFLPRLCPVLKTWHCIDAFEISLAIHMSVSLNERQSLPSAQLLQLQQVPMFLIEPGRPCMAKVMNTEIL